jgi:hypothetical protein
MARRAHRDEQAAVVPVAIERQRTAQSATATPPGKPQRSTEVHIGLIEVEIVSPSEPGLPEIPAPATAASRSFGVPIARKVTSRYGLNQR